MTFSLKALYAQSVAHKVLPSTASRPAFQDLAELTQKDLAKEYAKIYLQYNAVRTPFIHFRQAQFQSLLLMQPQLFKNLNLSLEPSFDNTVDFTNSYYDFYDVIGSTEYGICMGVTSVIRKLNMLAHYDLSNEYKATIPQEHEKKIEFYKGLIDNIMANKPTIIPGFHSTRQFTADEDLRSYFLKHSLDQWALNNVTIHGGLLQMMAGVAREMTPYYKRNLYHKLKRRLELGYNPKLFFALKGDIREIDEMRIHVVQVFKVDEADENGHYRIHYWDPNYEFRETQHENEDLAYLMRVANIIEVAPDGLASTSNYDDIGYLGIYKWDDAEIAEIFDNYLPFCRKYPELCNKK